MKLNYIPKISHLAPNQSVVTTEEGKFLMSYSSIIVFVPADGSRIQLGKDWMYSPTTGKYRNDFLREKGPITKMKIRSGEYVMSDQF